MTHQPQKKGFDLFSRHKRAQVAGYNFDSGFFHKLRSVNLLYAGSAFLQIATGISVIILSLLQLIHPVWAAAIMSILGSILTVTGSGMLYFTIKNTKSVDNMVKDSIQRIIRDQN